MVTAEQMERMQQKARDMAAADAAQREAAGEPERSAADIAKSWDEQMRAEADANCGVVNTVLSPFYEDHERLVRLPDVKRSATPAETEALLNGLIEDCRFLIREVAFHSARLTPDAQHRLQFLSSAQNLAVTGAKVGRTIAKLRQDKPPEPEENRYRMIIEHVNPSATPVRAAVRKAPVRRGGGGGEKSAMSPKITFKPLRPDQVWHPKAGPPHGTRNALKTGLHTAEIRDLRHRIAIWRGRVRATLAACL